MTDPLTTLLTAMATILPQLRQQLDTLLADLDEREQAIASAAEMLTESAVVQAALVQAALHQGAASERDRVLVLIDHQVDQLNRDGINALMLRTMRHMVAEMEA